MTANRQELILVSAAHALVKQLVDRRHCCSRFRHWCGGDRTHVLLQKAIACVQKTKTHPAHVTTIIVFDYRRPPVLNRRFLGISARDTTSSPSPIPTTSLNAISRVCCFIVEADLELYPDLVNLHSPMALFKQRTLNSYICICSALHHHLSSSARHKDEKAEIAPIRMGTSPISFLHGAW
jgi:hypothetical protein